MADLILSLGPNCRNAWNLRNHFKVERAFPFEWWITPAKSMLNMIEPGFSFRVQHADLHVTAPTQHNTVYNFALNVQHHYDFRRDHRLDPAGIMMSIPEDEVDKLNRKYQFLFTRFHSDLGAARSPVVVLNGSHSGYGKLLLGVPTNPGLTGAVKAADLAVQIRDRLGHKVRVLFVEVGPERYEEHPWGWLVSMPDVGIRHGT